MKHEIYIDGSCPQNPGPYGSFAGAILDDKGALVTIFVGQWHSDTTNNRMELMGLLVALENCIEGHEYTIYCDSKYVVNIYNHWIYGWMRKRKTMLNADIYNQFIPYMSNKSIKVEWVRGHYGNRWNKVADQLCGLSSNYPGVTYYKKNRFGMFDQQVEQVIQYNNV